MNSITQEAHFRQRVLKYSFKKVSAKQRGGIISAEKQSMCGGNGMTGHGKVWWNEAIDRITIRMSTQPKKKK